MNFKKQLPRTAKPGEFVGIDIEIFEQEEPIHIPTGRFACLSIVFENKDRYMLTDPKDVKPSLERLGDGIWCMHNALYDLGQLRRFGLDWYHWDMWDTMIVERDLFGGYYDSFSLDALCRRWLGFGLTKDVRADFSTATRMTKKMEQYAIKDGDVTVQIAKLQEEFAVEKGWALRHYHEIDKPAIWAVLDMPPTHINVEGWHKMSDRFAILGEEIENELGINTYSTKQVKRAIYEATGRRLTSTNAKIVLEPLLAELGGRAGSELLTNILDARRYRKASNTYGHLFPERWADENGNIHPSWRIVGTETGRMACRDPNLMNIPSRKLPIFRTMFTSKYDRGRIMVSDVSQQEPRCLAYFSRDKKLLEAFENKISVHKLVADEVNVDYDLGKAINLGLSYGLSEYGLARNANISKAKARTYLRDYFFKFRGVKAYMARARADGYRNGVVYSATGRPIWLNLYSKQWQNNAPNSPIQATAADHTKLAEVLFHQACLSNNIPYTIIMSVHDELVLDIEPETTKTYRPLIKTAWLEAGEQVIPGIPMEIDIKTGDSWGVK